MYLDLKRVWTSLQQTFSNLKLEPSTTKDSFTRSTPKVKPKTRGATNKPSVDANLTENEAALDTNTDVKPLFRVKPRVLKVFKTLFFNPSQTSLRDEVSWVNFLFASLRLALLQKSRTV
jgi:hypothetical protein